MAISAVVDALNDLSTFLTLHGQPYIQVEYSGAWNLSTPSPRPDGTPAGTSILQAKPLENRKVSLLLIKTNYSKDNARASVAEHARVT